MTLLRALLLLVPPALCFGGTPGAWIPARWTGGPLELERRASAQKQPDAAVRDAIANWYDPATLNLLEGSQINCVLVTWSAGQDSAIERRQQQLVGDYVPKAHLRGIAVLGLVYPGAEPSNFVPAAAAAHLDGLVLEGEFPPGFEEQVSRTLASASPSAIVIPIAKHPAPLRTPGGPVLAVEGVSPSSRNLADMGIRAGPSSEPWIESNIWLVRALRYSEPARPVWISHELEHGSAVDYARAVADAAVAGGRWIVSLDDELRANLRRGDAAAVAIWKRIGACLRFAEKNAEWSRFEPYGNLGIIVDAAAADRDMADEYLKLVARRQIAYRLIPRSRLSAASVGGLRALLATELAPVTQAERTVLSAFAGAGGLVVAGPSWGDPPASAAFEERAFGKGRVAIYKDPDPESIARELRELLASKDLGVVAFNVPSVITYTSRDVTGGRLLIQLLNYSDYKATDITIRVSGNFKTARLVTADAESADLSVYAADGQTDITIPKLSFWGGVLLEGEIP